MFLQGPHGPFYQELGRQLRRAGARTVRVTFNGGDRLFAGRGARLDYSGTLADWPGHLSGWISEHGVTDLVLYGDARPLHRAAHDVARAGRVRLHYFEEGYVRPHWVTYERDGVNGDSPAARLSMAEIAARMGGRDPDLPSAPDQWGALWHHSLYGALYHFAVACSRRRVQAAPHRKVTVGQEAAMQARRLAMLPLQSLRRRWRVRAIKLRGAPYHLVLLQLGHDASVQRYSRFDGMPPFVDEVMAAFAEGAPAHHHLVLKTHPLEDGRDGLYRAVREATRRHGLGGRVHLVPGGRLGPLLDSARSAATVNSTAGQQALWRGLPLRIWGQAIYGKPGLVSDQPPAAFFAVPERPDGAAYRQFRHFLLDTSQVPGGFYTGRGRAEALRHLADMMLDPLGPYDRQVQRAGAGGGAPALRLAAAGEGHDLSAGLAEQGRT
ncbi:capsule biosynthesis protein [Oceanomicrobium pacificus]|nr:capsule biosynthesis protein CapA [Oceanomicrobium pacificus]